MHMRLQLFSDTCFKRTSEDSLLECANTGLDRESKMRYQIPFPKIVENVKYSKDYDDIRLN